MLTLRPRGWSDKQIANHFNATGYLTPRGCKWLPQIVFSIRKKCRIRLERLGGVCDVTETLSLFSQG